MTTERESIIGRVEDIIFAGKLSILPWDIIFTNEGLIFIKMVKRNWIIIFGSPVVFVGILAGSRYLFFLLITLGFLPLVVKSMSIRFAKKKRGKS